MYGLQEPHFRDMLNLLIMQVRLEFMTNKHMKVIRNLTPSFKKHRHSCPSEF